MLVALKTAMMVSRYTALIQAEISGLLDDSVQMFTVLKGGVLLIFMIPNVYYKNFSAPNGLDTKFGSNNQDSQTISPIYVPSRTT